MTPELAAKLATLLPAGYSPDQFRILEVEGEISEAKPADKEAAALIAAVTAGPAMINENGKPTIMKVVAWMCHADMVNLNGHSFVASELASVAPTLFRAPDFGVMDWNHAAILNWNDDPQIIGVWYDAEYAWDAKANKGAGAFGIRVTGMMFSWLFPEQANEMIADQERDGVVRFSMACIPKSEEFSTINGERAVVLHDPVFFTNSALNVQNADVDANGKVSEAADVSTMDLLKELSAEPAPFAVPASDSVIQATDGQGNKFNFVLIGSSSASVGVAGNWVPVVGSTTGTLNVPAVTISGIINNDGDLTQVKADMEDDLMEEKIAELEAQLAAFKEVEITLRAQLDALTTESAAAVAAAEASKTALDELKTTTDALQVALTEAQDALEAKTAELVASEEKLAEYVAKETAAAAADKLAARIAELPEMYMKAHRNREQEAQDRIEAGWMALSDEDWELKKVELFGGFSAKVGFVARSLDHGKLPLVSAGDESDIKAQVKSLIK